MRHSRPLKKPDVHRSRHTIRFCRRLRTDASQAGSKTKLHPVVAAVREWLCHWRVFRYVGGDGCEYLCYESWGDGEGGEYHRIIELPVCACAFILFLP